MLPERMRHALTFALATAVWATAPAARAYIPPAEEIMRQWAESPAHGWKDASVVMRVSDPGQPTREQRLELRRPEQVLVRPQGHGGEAIAMREDGWARGQPLHLRAQPPPAPFLWAALLLPKTTRGKVDEAAARLVAVVRRHGVDPQLVTIGRIPRGEPDGDREVYIIGARPWEPERPQVWLDYRTLAPLRTRIDVPAALVPGALVDAPGSPAAAEQPSAPASTARPKPAGARTVRLEVRLRGWEDEPAAGRLPRVIEERVGSRLVRCQILQRVAFNRRPPASLFAWDSRH